MNNQNITLNIWGGSTVFPYAGVSVIPEKEAELVWFNLLQNEDLDVSTIHKSCELMHGTKTIGNKFIGYNNQWSTKGCSLDKNTSSKISLLLPFLYDQE